MNGSKAEPRDMGFMFGKMEIDTKVNGRLALSMDWGLIFLLMEMFMLGVMKQVSLMVKANIHGVMERSM